MELFVPLVDVNPVGALGEQVDRRGAEEIEILGAEDAVQRRHGPTEQYHQLELAFRAAPQRGSQAREADEHETAGEGEIFVQHAVALVRMRTARAEESHEGQEWDST